MKGRLLKVFYGILLVAITIQFFGPDRSLGGTTDNDIAKKYQVPDAVQAILKTSCYDCHSNHTEYPWYTNIQPVGWWLQHHINEGKRGLNFSEFNSYNIAKQYDRFNGIKKLVEEADMPLGSYLLIHRYAGLNDQQINVLTNWASALADTLKATYPADSLVMPKRKKP